MTSQRDDRFQRVRGRLFHHPGQYSLRTALLLFILLPVLVVSLLFGWYGLYSMERQAKARMQDEIELIARTIRIPLSHAMEHGRIHNIERMLHSAFRIGRVYGAYVYDAAGQQIAASGPTSPTRRRKAEKLVANGQRFGEFERHDGRPFFSYFLPLTDSGGRINGLLEVTRKGSDFQQYNQRIRLAGLGLLMTAALLLAVIVLYGHYRVFGRHVGAMLDGMVRVGRREGEYRLPLNGPREIRDLTAGINGMLDELGRHEVELARRQAEQARLEQRLQQSEKMAAIGRLAAGVAHELGTPLNVIDGRAQRALRQPCAEPVTHALGEIRAEVGRMSAILRQLMDFSRSRPPHRQPIAAERLLRNVLASLGDDADQAGVQCTVDGADASPLIHVDRLRIEQALNNVVRNAIQAARRQVRIGWFETDTTRGFVVEDDGPGVASALRQRIFEPFFTTKPVNEGTGLGLAVAHTAVEEHGGHIEIDRSARLGGAYFRIVLPGYGEES